MSSVTTRHAVFPWGVEGLTVLAWGLLLGAWLYGPIPLPGIVVVLAGTVLVGAFLGWGLPDPDYGTDVGVLVILQGGGLVHPRVALVAMLVGFGYGFLAAGVVGAALLAPTCFFLSVGSGVLARRFGA